MAVKPIVLTASGERLLHNAGFPVIATGFKDGENDDDLATVGQVRNSSQSFLYMQSTTLPEGETVTIPHGYKAIAFGTYTNNGTIINNGTFLNPSDPT